MILSTFANPAHWASSVSLTTGIIASLLFPLLGGLGFYGLILGFFGLMRTLRKPEKFAKKGIAIAGMILCTFACIAFLALFL